MKLLTAVSSLLALLVATKADGLGGLVYAPGHASLDYYSYPSYAFEYAVRDPHTGDNKAQWEKRDGDTVTGAYSLVEPDGTIRVVEYRADDKSGFNAVVKRIGPNLHPVSAPIYKAPLPVLGEKIVAPISIGPVAGLKGLSSAPLISGPIFSGSLASANLYKAPLIKDIGPIPQVNPILPAPILKEPLLGLSHGPILKEPLPYGPVLKGPIAPLLPAPIIKEPLLGPLSYGSILKEPIGVPAPLLKEPLLGSLSYGSISPGAIKGPLLGDFLNGPLIKESYGLPYGPIPVKEPIGYGSKELYSLPYGPINLKENIGYGGNLDYGLIGKGLLH